MRGRTKLDHANSPPSPSPLAGEGLGGGEKLPSGLNSMNPAAASLLSWPPKCNFSPSLSLLAVWKWPSAFSASWNVAQACHLSSVGAANADLCLHAVVEGDWLAGRLERPESVRELFFGLTADLAAEQHDEDIAPFVGEFR